MSCTRQLPAIATRPRRCSWNWRSQYPQQAAGCCTGMLWGCADDDLANGKDANLVRAINNDSWPCGQCWPSGTSRILPAWPVSITGPKTRRLAASSPSGVGKSGCGHTKSACEARTRRLARRPAHARRHPLVARPPRPTCRRCHRLIDAARCPMKRADRTPHRVECGRYRGSNHARRSGCLSAAAGARAPVNACDGVSGHEYRSGGKFCQVFLAKIIGLRRPTRGFPPDDSQIPCGLAREPCQLPPEIQPCQAPAPPAADCRQVAAPSCRMDIASVFGPCGRKSPRRQSRP